MSGPGPGSSYYIGPFGRMLPTADGPFSEQQSEHPANLQDSEDPPYQLPPPRVPTSLQFGTDMSLRTDNSDGKDIGSQKPEQLPSLSQIFTTEAPPGSHSQVYAPLTPGTERRESTYNFPHHDLRLSAQRSQSAMHDRVKGRPEPLPPSHNTSLPSLSQVTLQSHRDLSHHTSTRSDPSTAPFPLPLSYTSANPHDQGPGGEPSSSDSSGRAAKTPVRPAVIDERVIEGEGLCFIYADGSYCPQTIDGTPVNANWGVTKAGRPRKRLALACLTCREKKIKCNPATEAICDQCRKSGRECRFESAPDPTHIASDSSPSLYNVTRDSASVTSYSGANGQSPASEGSTLTPSAQDATYESMADADRALRSRSYRFPPPFSSADDTLGRASAHIENRRSPEYSEILGELKESNLNDPLMTSWYLDPYEIDPETTLHYTECFFLHVNNVLYHMFPHSRFPLWLKTCPTKSAEDKMLLYSMMALGSVFSNKSDKLGAMKQYARIARFAINKSQHKLSLQLAQSHIIMSLWYYATGSLAGSWDSIGAAGRAVFGLRYNVESGGVVNQTQTNDYGLHPQALIECRRRTFWIAFVLDRFSSLYSASLTSISSDAALLRLPCREEIYEAQQYATVPYFQTFLNYSATSPENDRSTLSAMAFMIEIMAVWGDVSLHVTRLPHIPPEAYNRLSEDFHATIVQKANHWINRLPDYLAFSSMNMERNIRQRKADTFISIHLFYHASLMKLYRHARYQTLRPEILAQYIHRARYHAVEIIRIALAFDQYSKDIKSSQLATESSASQIALLNPFLGYLILSAVDVLGAAGLASQLQECISYTRSALDTVQELSRYWDSSLQLVAVLQKRLGLMVGCLNERSVIEEKQGFALEGPSLETKAHTGALLSHPPSTFGEDLFSGSMPKDVLLNALRVDETLISVSNIAWIRDP
ncbi:unnamed protein product [Penicillium salamii]|uniref:Zn(2)-C6 fungal-type domain-containing protein n=1 Tax=Penicillium salamii TaxID=1612424 RepID=A0A9W4NIX4_9EURO|nr:unnamed protein product [Penicillium salamii]CAG8384388.1 unnamed protein product [Penicillium salamii]CAG8403587.1 unnamed protein product [Penicillium salamii]CAG8416817.1 unnamed protein product [Penicillium salamii]